MTEVRGRPTSTRLIAWSWAATIASALLVFDLARSASEVFAIAREGHSLTRGPEETGLRFAVAGLGGLLVAGAVSAALLVLASWWARRRVRRNGRGRGLDYFLLILATVLPLLAFTAILHNRMTLPPLANGRQGVEQSHRKDDLGR